MYERSNLRYLDKLFLISPAFFLVGINKYISPVLYIGLIFFLLSIFQILRNHRLHKISALVLSLFVLPNILILVLQYYQYELRYGLINELFRLVFPLLFIIISIEFFSSKRIETLITYAKFLIYSNTILFLAETVYRLANSEFSLEFYSYKYNSLLYPDSNFTALNIVVLLIFVDIVAFNKLFISQRTNFFLKTCLITLLVLTFSRTAYFTYIAYLFLCFAKNTNRVIVILILLCILTLIQLNGNNSDIISTMLNFEEDGSFQTKQYILDSMIKYFSESSQILFLGIGSGNAILLIERESHNLYGLALEMGVLWGVNYILLLSYFIFIGRKNSFLILLPIIISMLTSLLPITYMSFSYVLVVLLIFLNKKEFR